MKKRNIWIIAASIILTAATVFGYLYIKKVKAPSASIFNAIPDDAAFLIYAQNSSSSWKKMSGSSIIWEDLKALPLFMSIDSAASIIDSVLNGDPSTASIYENLPVLMSGHYSGKKSVSCLFVVSVTPVNEARSLSFMRERFKGYAIIEKVDNAQRIYTISKDQRTLFSYAAANGLLILSRNADLVKRSLERLGNNAPALDGSSFQKVNETMGSNVDMNLYVNFKKLPAMLSTIVRSSSAKDIELLSSFNSWAGMDVSMHSNYVMMNGFSYAPDSLNTYLSLFKKQQPQRPDIIKTLPDNTVSFLHFGFGDFKGYYEGYKNWLELYERKKPFDSLCAFVQDKYGLDIEYQLVSWIENEAAVVFTEPEGNSLAENSFVFLRSNNIENAMLSVHTLAGTIAKNKSAEVKLETYQGHLIAHLDIPSALPLMLGSHFAQVRNNYFTSIDNYVVFANSPVDLKNFIDKYDNGRTLYNNKQFGEFMEELPTESNILLYTSPARSHSIYEQFVTDTLADDLKVNSGLMDNFEGAAIQFVSNNDLFYTNVFIKRNPSSKQEHYSIWETHLDTSVSSAPQLVVNHNTGVKEVLVQDDNNSVYLISNTGKILWKRDMKERIMSNVEQIDIYKNNKLQMLFNTRSYIHLIDRNGKEVPGYPVKLKASATNGMVVYDYEGKKDYRILIACKDKRIYNYNSTGKLVEGWNFRNTKAVVKTDIKRCVVNGKDHIVAIDSLGYVYIVDRRGDARLSVKEQVNLGGKEFFLDPGVDFSRSWLVMSDSLGNVERVSLTGKHENIKFSSFSGNPRFWFADINLDKVNDYIFLDSNKLWAFGYDRLPLFEYELPGTSKQPVMVFKIGDRSLVGAVSSQTNEVYLLNNSGALLNDFPLYGSTAFTIGDINNDKTQVLLVAGADHKIYAYPLDLSQ